MKIFKLYNSIIVPSVLIFLAAVLFSKSTFIEDANNILDAAMTHKIEGKKLDRAVILEKFLKKYNSPLAVYADTFVDVADRYGMDYRLLPAISCIESTCGQNIIPGSFNAWGWGIYGNNVIKFKDFNEAIETVGKGIFDGYIKNGLDTPAKIAPIYTPPMSNHWLNGVTYFMNQINEISMENIES